MRIAKGLRFRLAVLLFSRRNSAAHGNPELLHLGPQRLARNAKALRRLGPVVPVLAQRVLISAISTSWTISRSVDELSLHLRRGLRRDDGWRQTARTYSFAGLRAENHAVHFVCELANIAGPRITDEQLERVWIESGQRLTLFGGVSLEEVRREPYDVFSSLAKRRKPNREDVQPIVQVTTEAAFIDSAYEIGICGREHPDIDGLVLVAANGANTALLQHAQ
jgi:hypothetical protein